jgi:MFS superfamily sulfate permease-like transporter
LNVTPESKSNQITLRLVFSLMIATMSGVLAAFLAFAGVRYGFKWPGLMKSVVTGILLVACLTYGFKRGDKDLRIMREMPSGDKEVGIAHAGLIMLFVCALTALAMWILVGPPQSPVTGPLG